MMMNPKEPTNISDTRKENSGSQDSGRIHTGVNRTASIEAAGGFPPVKKVK